MEEEHVLIAERSGGPRSWPLLVLVPAVPVFSLLVLRSVWWTFALYHLGACLALPLVHSLLVRRVGFRRHLALVGLRAGGRGLRPGIVVGAALGLVLGGGTVAVFAFGHDAFLAGRDIDAALAAWGITPKTAPLMLAFMILGNGASEELFWRGWLQTRLRAGHRAALTLPVGAAAYASYHLVTVTSFAPGPAVVLLFMTGIYGAGVFFGWLRERFGTVWPPLLAHTGATAGYMAVYLIWVAGR